MKTIIYFVRHGKVYNPKNVLYGRLPRFGLAEEGRQEITQTATYLKKEKIDAIYSSSLLRAIQTAEIIKKTNNLPKIVISKYLLEINTSMQGKSFSFIKTLNYDVFAGPGKAIKGETIEQVLERVEKFVNLVINKHPGQQVVAVTHGDIMMLLKARLEHLPIVNDSLRPGPEHYVQQGEIYKVTCDENVALTLESIFKPTL